ncbi:MAG: hypothetical protein KF852_11035, partial [Saprospiraceae bacterium]|nr:hypothetical protein [Saprospiraceae bacterium]
MKQHARYFWNQIPKLSDIFGIAIQNYQIISESKVTGISRTRQSLTPYAPYFTPAMLYLSKAQLDSIGFVNFGNYPAPKEHCMSSICGRR